MSHEFEIFVSSKMAELMDERTMLNDLIPSLSREAVALKGWVYEHSAHAAEHTIREEYLEALKDSELYIGLFWKGYGQWTIDEFNIARGLALPIRLYVKVLAEGEKRDPQLEDLLKRLEGVEYGLTPRYFKDVEQLRVTIAESINQWLDYKLTHRPGSTQATYARTSAEVPEQPEKLIGREDLIAEVNGLLDADEKVLLQGLGGMGKTSLAATIAAGRLKNGGAVLWQKMGSEEAKDVFEALAHPFGLQKEMAGTPDNEKVNLARKILIDEGVNLVVLDDAWDGAALNIVLRAIPKGLATLVTSRSRYGIRKIISVGKLSPQHALETLRFYAGDANTNDNDSANALCEHLGYHAFALEVAGKSLLADDISPAKLLERVKDAPQNMQVPDEFGEEERRSVGALLEDSFTRLDTEAQRMFLSMGAFFAPKMTAEILAIYENTDVEAIHKALQTLIRRGLVERIPANENSIEHFRLHDLAFNYANARNSDKERRKAFQACRDYLQRHKEPNPENRAAMRPEFENLFESISWFTATMRRAISLAQIDEASQNYKIDISPWTGLDEWISDQKALIHMLDTLKSFAEAQAAKENPDQ